MFQQLLNPARHGHAASERAVAIYEMAPNGGRELYPRQPSADIAVIFNAGGKTSVKGKASAAEG
eukprot:IDg14858t1